MKITLAQIRLKTANFEFNYNNILKYATDLDAANSDLIVFPDVSLAQLGALDMKFDDKCLDMQDEMFVRLAGLKIGPAMLFGNVMIKNGEIFYSVGGFFELNGQKIFVSDEFREDIQCDLYVLLKNGYYTFKENLADNIIPNSNFIYMNSVALVDENVYAGRSFAKNACNDVLLRLPLCQEAIEDVDFTFSDFVSADESVVARGPVLGGCDESVGGRGPALGDCDESVEEDIYNVLAFALREYCENTGFKRVLLGLSGGIDSALTAAIAVEALGAENVFGVLMPSMFSSAGSVEDSLKLAEKLQMQVETRPITPLFEAFMSESEHKVDLAEENLQSRLRGLILMFKSNREGYLLLSTGNKSEIAMGYGTLYGDMAGGLNLLSDLTKTNVYKLSNWINRKEIIIPQEIIDKAPSAELRPNQKDQDSLPDYAVLDEIIEMYVEEAFPTSYIYEKHGKNLVDTTIKKLYRAEFKRRQCCLGIRLTERAFCSNVKFPIAQGLY